MALFDRYCMIDWSARAAPVRGADSIWSAAGERVAGKLSEPRLRNPPTRAKAMAALQGEMRDALVAGDRLLVGVDFPLGWPSGTVAAAGLTRTGLARTGVAPWQALWRFLRDEIEDGDDNANNRFDVAAALNERLSGGAGPFWGCPPGAASACLSPRRDVRPEALGLAERRACEQRLPRAQPVWKLYTTGSVGSQAILGMARLAALLEDASVRSWTWVWPFEITAVPEATSGPIIVIAEIYPSLWVEGPAPAGWIKDAFQVTRTLHTLAALDAQGALAPLLALDGLTPALREAVTGEEAWILGVPV